MSEANQKLVWRHFEEIFNRKNLAVCDEIMHNTARTAINVAVCRTFDRLVLPRVIARGDGSITCRHKYRPRIDRVRCPCFTGLSLFVESPRSVLSILCGLRPSL